MILLDVNILVHAFRQDSPRHDTHHKLLQELVAADSPFAAPDLVLSGFLRVVTHPRIFDPFTPLPQALEFTEALRRQPNFLPIAPGPRHWQIFTRLCRDADARGNLIPDAYLAALVIESGSELLTNDRDFARFPGLRWRHNR